MPFELGKNIFGQEIISLQYRPFLALDIYCNNMNSCSSLQGSTENIPNPFYARVVPVHVPKVSDLGEVIFNDQAKHIDVTTDYEEFEHKDMQSCFEGIETDVAQIEERNVYCGAYNVLVLSNS